MFTGTVIDELMAVVASAQETAEVEMQAANGILSMPLPEYRGETALAGVA